MVSKRVKDSGLTRENYFDMGDERTLYVSNSSLSLINPAQGGSFLRFKRYMANQIEKAESRSLEKGKLVHDYVENPHEFVLDDAVRPSDAITSVIYYVLTNTVRTEGPEKLLDYQEKILEGCQLIKYGQGWKEETRIGKVAEGEHFFQHLITTSGKKMVTEDLKKTLEGVRTAIQNSEMREHIIDQKPSQYTFDEAVAEGYEHFIVKEFAIAFLLDDVLCKALLDYLHIDFKNKTITIRDTKTTSKPVSLFMGSIAPEQVVEEGRPGRILGRILPGSFQTYRYYRQFAFYYQAVLSLHPSLSSFTVAFVNDVVETSEPFEARSYGIPKQWIEAGIFEVEMCINLVKEYRKEEKLEGF